MSTQYNIERRIIENPWQEAKNPNNSLALPEALELGRPESNPIIKKLLINVEKIGDEQATLVVPETNKEDGGEIGKPIFTEGINHLGHPDPDVSLAAPSPSREVFNILKEGLEIPTKPNNSHSRPTYKEKIESQPDSLKGEKERATDGQPRIELLKKIVAETFKGYFFWGNQLQTLVDKMLGLNGIRPEPEESLDDYSKIIGILAQAELARKQKQQAQRLVWGLFLNILEIMKKIDILRKFREEKPQPQTQLGLLRETLPEVYGQKNPLEDLEKIYSDDNNTGDRDDDVIDAEYRVLP